MNWNKKNKRICLILMVVFSIMVVGIIKCWAGEKEELQWKGRALIADFQLKQQQLSEANKALEEFIKELDAKGLIFQNNQVIEKPKPKIEEPKKKEEPKK